MADTPREWLGAASPDSTSPPPHDPTTACPASLPRTGAIEGDEISPTAPVEPRANFAEGVGQHGAENGHAARTGTAAGGPPPGEGEESTPRTTRG
eukprot:618447-Pyramimonas_sp.AAC.1